MPSTFDKTLTLTKAKDQILRSKLIWTMFQIIFKKLLTVQCLPL